jgi:hypothetical protein
MIGRSILRRASFQVAVVIGTAFFVGSSFSATAAPDPNDACALLSPADIAKATTLKLENGSAGKPIPGVLGRCTWTGDGDTKVIVTLGDAQHIGLTVSAVEQSGGEKLPGLGTRAVGNKGAGFTGGGYVVNVLDAKGGFGVSILDKDGTRERAVALAKLVEGRR